MPLETVPVEKTSAYVARLQAHAANTRTFLSNAQKQERERAVCRAFLRSIGLRFANREIVASCDEPADVCFRDARFQIRDHLAGRRRGEEWKQRQTRWTKARWIRDTRERVTWPTPMRRVELVDAVTDALKSKSEKYGMGGCSKTDALVYADITGSRFLIPRSIARDVSRLEQQGWRSVSVLFPPYGVVLLARDSAPAFLRHLVGTTRRAWRRPDGLFDA
jgi:putative endonuclease (uncharacterized protein DUF1780)